MRNINNNEKNITSALEELGAELGISEEDFGGKLKIEGKDPVVCSWLQDFGLFPANAVHGVGLPESMMAAPGLNARLRPEFDLPLVKTTGPLGEMSVLPPQVELSEFKLGPRFSGDPNGASKLDWSVFTKETDEQLRAKAMKA